MGISYSRIKNSPPRRRQPQKRSATRQRWVSWGLVIRQAGGPTPEGPLDAAASVPSFRLPVKSFVGLNQQKSYRTPTGNLLSPLGKTHPRNRKPVGGW